MRVSRVRPHPSVAQEVGLAHQLDQPLFAQADQYPLRRHQRHMTDLGHLSRGEEAVSGRAVGPGEYLLFQLPELLPAAAGEGRVVFVRHRGILSPCVSELNIRAFSSSVNHNRTERI